MHCLADDARLGSSRTSYLAASPFIQTLLSLGPAVTVAATAAAGVRTAYRAQHISSETGGDMGHKTKSTKEKIYFADFQLIM